MEFPILFKRATGGKVLQWRIWTEGNKIHSEYGQQGGKLQTAVEVVLDGKNAGRANATTPEQQAELQAQGEWNKKRDRQRYSPSLEEETQHAAPAPMLAHKFSEHGHKISYPCMVQPKLDGIRCLAVADADGKVTFWSRTGTPIVALPHLQRAVEKFCLANVVLDGEIYAHALKDEFETIVSAVRKNKPAPEELAQKVQLHVYDIVRPDLSFLLRHELIQRLCRPLNGREVELVPTYLAEDQEELLAYFDAFRAEGYEGAMARNITTAYEVGKRSYSLLKLKTMLDSEYPIVGVKSGVGRMAECAIFRCRAPNGEEFDVKMDGPLEALKAYLLDESTWRGKVLTVQYQGLTNTGLPRFPVGKAIRWEGDA